jgi:hypothetical protein
MLRFALCAIVILSAVLVCLHYMGMVWFRILLEQSLTCVDFLYSSFTVAYFIRYCKLNWHLSFKYGENFLYNPKFWFLITYCPPVTFTVSKEVFLFSAVCDAGYTHIKFSVYGKVNYLICFCKNSRFTISNKYMWSLFFIHLWQLHVFVVALNLQLIGSERIGYVIAVFSKNDSTTHIPCCKPQRKQWFWRPHGQYSSCIWLLING